MGGARVLIVDDEPQILSSTALLLRQMGFDVATHDDAATIHDALLRERPRLLLQDVHMPGLDLDALMEGLRRDERLRGLRVVLFTASMDADETGDRVGAWSVVEKPFRPEHLAAVVAAALAA